MLRINTDSLVISPEILKLISQIDEFKGQWLALGKISRDTLTDLKRTATIESVASSTRIEGSKLTDSQVETLLSNLKHQSFESRDEQEVAGYAAAMDFIFDSCDYITISENHIQQLHQILLQYSSKDERHRGNYKTLSNNVAAFDASGNQIGIVFETSAPFDTPRDMLQLVEWTTQAEKDQLLHPLIIIGVFIVRFLAIHPFQDGNGRISRVLTTLLLLKYGYDHVPYASLERIIEDNKNLYYKALRATQTTFNEERPDWSPWLLFFLRSLLRQSIFLKKKLLKQDSALLSQLSSNAVTIINLFEDRHKLTIREIAQLTKISRNTVKATINKLFSLEKINRHGKGRGVYYTLKS